MSLYRRDDARPLGQGFRTGLGCVTDVELARTVANYKRAVANSYKSLAVDELAEALPVGPSLVSPKIDGQLWYLVADEGEVFLVNPSGRVIYGSIPLLDEAAQSVLPRVRGRTVLAGELWAVPESGRVRSAGLAGALSGEGDAPTKRVAFTAFDLVWGGDAQAASPLPEYRDRLAVLQRLTEGGKRVRAVATDELGNASAVAARYAEQVTGGRAEGLVVRAANARVYKVKPVIHIDAAVVGYTIKADEPDQARSLLLALMREDGTFQLLGSVGNMGDEASRRDILARVAPSTTASNYRHASRDGALYRFVKPEAVVQFRVNDVQSSDPRGDDVLRMVLRFEPGGWVATRRMPGVAIYHPIFEGFREDKGINPNDLRMGQVLDRCCVTELEAAAEATDLPRSSLVARRVFTKLYRGTLSVRKVIAWRTNKHEVDPRYPAYVVHYTDYSPGRQDPLQRTVRCAPTLAGAVQELEELLASKKVITNGTLTRGWTEEAGRRLDFHEEAAD